MVININHHHRDPNKKWDSVIYTKNTDTKNTYCRVSCKSTMVAFGGKSTDWEVLKEASWISGKLLCLKLDGGHIGKTTESLSIKHYI